MRVSFDRPYGRYAQFTSVVNDPLSVGAGEFISFEFPLSYFLEQHGYDVSYVSNSDMVTPERGLKGKCFISVGHDEYWDRRQYDSVVKMRDAGVPAGAVRTLVDAFVSGALAAHARDELGLTAESSPRPFQAAFASALAFSLGAALPTLAAFLAAKDFTVMAVSVAALIFLGVLGAIGARLGGAPILKPALRVTFWGALAMAVTAGIGALVGRAV